MFRDVPSLARSLFLSLSRSLFRSLDVSHVHAHAYTYTPDNDPRVHTLGRALDGCSVAWRAAGAPAYRTRCCQAIRSAGIPIEPRECALSAFETSRLRGSSGIIIVDQSNFQSPPARYTRHSSLFVADSMVQPNYAPFRSIRTDSWKRVARWKHRVAINRKKSSAIR